MGMNTWNLILDTIAKEYSDFSLVEMIQLTIRLAMAVLIGGILGWQREAAGKVAGFRTHILVALGAAAFIIIPQQAGLDSQGISRIVQGIITGIGFLGAGCIIKQQDNTRVTGITTAASIWFTAGVGIAAGFGRGNTALILGLFGWITLAGLVRLERRIATHSNTSPMT